MGLNNKITQWIIGGIVIGVLLTLGVQYLVKSSQDNATAQKLAAYTAGHKTATDKVAYAKNFVEQNFSGVATVQISTSKAESSCEGLHAEYTSLSNVIQYGIDMLKNYSGEDKWDRVNALWDLLDFNQSILDTMRSLGCNDI